MAKRCVLTGKQTRSANNVSHAKNRTKRKQFPNLKNKKVYFPSLGKFVSIKISTKGIKIINKIGVEALMKKSNVSLKDLKIK